MKVERIFESVLYAHDLEAAAAFYKRVLGLDVLDQSDVMLAFRCEGGMLLIFDPVRSIRSGRTVPSHGARGPGHLAFAADPETLDGWRRHLQDQGVEIEAEIEWDNGGTSIYFRDPAGNSLELAAPTLWGGEWEF